MVDEQDEEKSETNDDFAIDVIGILRKISRDPVRIMYLYVGVMLVGILAFMHQGPPLVLLGIAISLVVGAVIIEQIVKRRRKR